MEQLDSNILKKQELLKIEIIQKNYDKDLFLEYCISRKENGDDLNNWTIEELENTISLFKESQMKENQNKKEKETNQVTKEEINIDIEKIKTFVINIVKI